MTDVLLVEWGIWKLLASYYQASLVKTAELDPAHHYLFAMHPHGILATSAWLSFCTDATGFSTTFPGIRVFAGTLDLNFFAPLHREYSLLHGLRSVSKQALKAMLAGRPGNSVMLAVGGAAESLLAAPGRLDLVLTCRKGFVKVAMETGARLVPVLAFGENDIFDTYVAAEGTFTCRVFRTLKHHLGFATPIFWGVGFRGGLGLLPKPVRLTTVVGIPQIVPKITPQMDQPTVNTLVEKTHAEYVCALRQLWDEHSKTVGAGCRPSLAIVA
ncbi:MAG: hypothetical protein WDW36_002198 [Sanguina aurantia]